MPIRHLQLPALISNGAPEALVDVWEDVSPAQPQEWSGTPHAQLPHERCKAHPPQIAAGKCLTDHLAYESDSPAAADLALRQNLDEYVVRQVIQSQLSRYRAWVRIRFDALCLLLNRHLAGLPPFSTHG